MTLLTPMAGLFLALAVIPPLILLYFLKLRRKPQPISTTLLWKKSVEDLRANAPFQKLRRSLLLFLQLIALLLLALSVMQPQIQAGGRTGGKTVMLIDQSASMASIDRSDDASGPEGERTRLDEAKRRAREKIESLYSGGLFAGDGGETMIVVFADKAEIACRFTDSKQQLLNAIDRIQPTHGETRIAEALQLARAYTTNVNPDQTDRPIADPATLELYSDGRIADLPEQVLRGEAMNFHAVGSADADNVAIGGLAVERPFDRPNSVEVFVSLLNFNVEPVTCNVQLAVNTVARGIEETTVAAAARDAVTGALTPGRANVVFTPFEQPRGGVIEVAILRDDDLAVDNVAQVVVAPPTRLVVGVVSERASRSIVIKALEGMKFERLEKLSPARYESLAAEGGLDAYDVIVLDNYKPAAMPSGRYLSFGATPPVTGFNDFGEGQRQVILSVKEDHPSLRFVTYDKIFISQFRLVEPGDDVQVLFEGSRGPAVLAVSRGSLQVIHCTFDPHASNWPFERSFVTFLFNAVDFLGHSGEAITSASLRPGEAITARLPVSATDIRLQTPDRAEPTPLTPTDPSQFAWGPIRLTGPYELSWSEPGSDERQNRTYAVNLLSETEGRLDIEPVMTIGQERVAGRSSDESTYTPLWPWAVGLCLLVLMVEWWVYHRKAYV